MKYQIIISIKSQNLLLLFNNKVKFTYKISSAKAGIGQLKGSYKTPLGHHVIRAKIGDNNPDIFSLRRKEVTGDIWSKRLNDQLPKGYYLRILWLSGSRDRY